MTTKAVSVDARDVTITFNGNPLPAAHAVDDLVGVVKQWDGRVWTILPPRKRPTSNWIAGPGERRHRFGPLDELLGYALRHEVPPIAWVIQHAPDGSLDGIWSRAPWRVRLAFACWYSPAFQRMRCRYAERTGGEHQGKRISRALLRAFVVPTIDDVMARVRERKEQG